MIFILKKYIFKQHIRCYEQKILAKLKRKSGEYTLAAARVKLYNSTYTIFIVIKLPIITYEIMQLNILQ